MKPPQGRLAPSAPKASPCCHRHARPTTIHTVLFELEPAPPPTALTHPHRDYHLNHRSQATHDDGTCRTGGRNRSAPTCSVSTTARRALGMSFANRTLAPDRRGRVSKRGVDDHAERREQPPRPASSPAQDRRITDRSSQDRGMLARALHRHRHVASAARHHSRVASRAPTEPSTRSFALKYAMDSERSSRRSSSATPRSATTRR